VEAQEKKTWVLIDCVGVAVFVSYERNRKDPLADGGIIRFRDARPTALSKI